MARLINKFPEPTRNAAQYAIRYDRFGAVARLFSRSRSLSRHQWRRNAKVEGWGASWHGHVTAVIVGLEHSRYQLSKKLMKMASAQCYEGHSFSVKFV